jgi:hypothetical protein
LEPEIALEKAKTLAGGEDQISNPLRATMFKIDQRR